MNYRAKYPIGSCLIALVAHWYAAGGALASPLNDIRKLVESGQFEAAYKSSQANPQEMGTVHYDFLFGLAAIGSGHVAEGILALERHLASVPGNDRARLEMARGYFMVGDYGQARTEFEFVLKHNPPKEVQQNIRRYLDSMQTRDSTALRSNSKFYIDFGFGEDSNVNGGTFNNDVNLMSGSVPIDNPSAKAVADTYRQLATGGQWVKRVSPQLMVFAGGDLDWRANTFEKSYDLSNYGVFSGFSYLKGPGVYRVSIADSFMEVNRVAYRNMLSATAEAQYTLGNGRALMGFVQYGETAHAGANRVRDSKMTTLGGSLTQAFQALPLNPSVGIRVSTAQESNMRMRKDLSRSVQTARFFTGISPIEKLGVNAGLTWQQQDFQQADIAFGTSRSDVMYGADLGVNYALSRNLSARWEWQLSDNHSNQSLYEYTRRAWSIKVRNEF